MHVDFGITAGDYGRYRPGFPDSFFEHVRRYGISVPGQSVVDLGTGTGALARAFARRSARVVGIDPSPGMLRQAVALTRAEGVAVHYLRARAEATGLAPERFDLACAGQCWHWFRGAQAAVEARRLLRPGGQLLIAYFCYLPEPGTLGGGTEEIILRHNPGWPLAGCDGRFPPFRFDLSQNGFEVEDVFEYDQNILFTHDAWRGRFRACNGVLTLPPEQIAQFEAELTVLLNTHYPEPLVVPHRIWGIVAKKPQ